VSCVGDEFYNFFVVFKVYLSFEMLFFKMWFENALWLIFLSRGFVVNILKGSSEYVMNFIFFQFLHFVELSCDF